MFEAEAFGDFIDSLKTGRPMRDPKAVLGAFLALQAERNFLRSLVVKEHTNVQAMKGRPHNFALSDAEVFMETAVLEFRRDFDVATFYPRFTEIPG